MGIKYEILFSAEHWQWQHRRQKQNKKSEHSHVYGKRIDNSVFINTNWGFTSELFVQEQTQMVRVDKNKTKLKPGRNWTELNNLKFCGEMFD